MSRYDVVIIAWIQRYNIIKKRCYTTEYCISKSRSVNMLLHAIAITFKPSSMHRISSQVPKFRRKHPFVFLYTTDVNLSSSTTNEERENKGKCTCRVWKRTNYRIRSYRISTMIVSTFIRLHANCGTSHHWISVWLMRLYLLIYIDITSHDKSFLSNRQ